MKYKLIYFFLFFVIIIPSCKNNDKNSSSEKAEKSKKETPPTNQDPANDEWKSNFYRNTLYDFRIEFPKKWTYDKGSSDITLARAMNGGLGATIEVSVSHLTEADEKNDIREIISKDELIKEVVKLLGRQKISPQSEKIQDALLNNFPAYIAEFEQTQKVGTLEIICKTIQIQSVVKSVIYQITLNIPLDFFNAEIRELFQKTIESFVFETV